MDQWRPQVGEIRSSSAYSGKGGDFAHNDTLKSGGSMSGYGTNPQGQGQDDLSDSLHLLSQINGTSGSLGMNNMGGMSGQFANNNMMLLGMNQQGMHQVRGMQMAGPGGVPSNPTHATMMQVRTGGGTPSQLQGNVGMQQFRTGEALAHSFQGGGMSRQQVRTGEAVPSFQGSMGGGMVRQQVRTGEATPSFPNDGMGGMGMPSFPNRLGMMERSSSEPTLNNMMGMFDHPPPPVAPMEHGMPANNNQQSGSAGRMAGGFDDFHAMGSNHGSDPSGGANPGVGPRRHSEPTLSLLADIFDDGTKVGGDDSAHNNGSGGGSGGSGMEGNRGAAFSPVELDGLGNLFGKPVSSRRDSVSNRPRASSAPQITEMMFQLQNLEPEQVHTPTPSSGHAFGSAQDAQARDHGFDMRTDAAAGQGKRSRSVDPLEMFRRGDDSSGHLSSLSSQSAHALPQGRGGFDQGGLSQDEQQRLEALGIYSRDKPKRRRSAPLLNQDIFAADGNGAKNDAAVGHPTSGPPNANLQQAGAPVQKNNINLIQMLLGVEGGMGNVPGGPNGIGGLSEVCQEIPAEPNTQFKRANSAPMSSQSLSLSDVPGSSTQVFHTPKPQRQQLSGLMPQQPLSASMLQQAASNPMMLNAPQQTTPGNAPHQSPPAPQQPPPLNINNADDLNLVLSAVKETQTNLQTLQPMVMQLGDPEAMEEIAKAFKITASSSQYVLASDLPSAYAALNDAWAKIKSLEERLAKGPAPAPLHGLSGASLMEQMLMENMIMNQVSQAQGHPPFDPTNTYLPITAEKADEAMKPKPKPRPRRIKKPSPPPSPIQDVIALEDLPTQNEGNPDVIMERLKGMMERTQMSQKQLQQWDRKNGLPKSHSQTMVNSNRSRKQLQNKVMKLETERLFESDSAPRGGSDDRIQRSVEVAQSEEIAPRRQNIGGLDDDDAIMDPDHMFNDNVLDVLNMCT